MQTRQSKDELVQQYHNQLTLGLNRIRAHLESPNVPKDKIPLLLNKQRELQQQLNTLKTRYYSDQRENPPDTPKQSPEQTTELKSGKSISDLLTRTYPEMTIEPRLEQILVELGDSFVEQVVYNSCLLASLGKESEPKRVGIEAVSLVLKEQWGIEVPPLFFDETKNKMEWELGRKDLSGLMRTSKTQKQKRSAGIEGTEPRKKRAK